VKVVSESDEACSSSAVSGVSTCLHGGTCVTTADGPRCRCRWGDRGRTCHKSAWTFQPPSYVEHSDVVTDVKTLYVFSFLLRFMFCADDVDRLLHGAQTSLI